jgi:teichuronic acid biosynthesis glycosyltransferase TuaC
MALISVVTPLFPLPDEPYRGKPIYETVLALQKFADIEVFCPTRMYPPLLNPRSYRHGRRHADRSYRPPGIERVEYIEYNVFPLITRPWNGYLCERQIYPRLAASRSSAVLSFWVYPDGYAAVQAGHRLGKPVIVSARGSDVLRIRDPFTGRFVRATLRSADSVITVSEELRERAIELGAPPERTSTISNGIDKTIFHYQPRDEARRNLGFAGDGRIIFFVGWLSPTKGLAELLEAFQALAKQDAGLHLVCAGEGAFRSSMVEFAARNGLDQRMRLLGGCSSGTVAMWMNAADVFCLPSHSEGCPNVVVEATACGCPVVATAVGGTPTLVSAQTGMLVPAHDAGQLAAALFATLAKVWDRARISTLWSRSWDDVAAEIYDICRDLTQR